MCLANTALFEEQKGGCGMKNGTWKNLFKKEEETWSVTDGSLQVPGDGQETVPEAEEYPNAAHEIKSRAGQEIVPEAEGGSVTGWHTPVGSGGEPSVEAAVESERPEIPNGGAVQFETDPMHGSVDAGMADVQQPDTAPHGAAVPKPHRKRWFRRKPAGAAENPVVKKKNWKVILPAGALAVCVVVGICALLVTDLPFLFRVNNEGVLTGYYGLGGWVSIPDSVTAIGEEAFAGRDLLLSVSIPDRVTKIQDGAFSGCSNLRTADLPADLTDLGAGAFAGCGHLKETEIPDSITYLGRGVYRNCTRLAKVTLPSGLTELPDEMFLGCTRLKDLAFPRSLLSIGSMALSGCSNIKTLVLPNGLTYIGGDAFAGCSKLTELQIPEGVTQIGWRTFQNCTGLKRVILSEQTKVIREEAFSGCTNLSQLHLPDALVEVGNRAFWGCDALQLDPFLISEAGVLLTYLGEDSEVRVPDHVTAIGISAFAQNQRIRSVELPEGLKRIGASAFYGCMHLEHVEIPEGVERIGSRAFESCDRLTQIILPESLAQIGERCFCYSGLQQVYYGGTSVKWKQIRMEEDNAELSAAQITYQYRK